MVDFNLHVRSVSLLDYLRGNVAYTTYQFDKHNRKPSVNFNQTLLEGKAKFKW